MTKPEDPRLEATRVRALDAVLEQLQEEGVLAVTHASISARTGISRSTLYRHWATPDDLLNSAFLRAISAQVFPPKPNGPLEADLRWLLEPLVTALEETPWGRIAPQVVAAAETDERARIVMRTFMNDRFKVVRGVFEDAKARGEIAEDTDLEPLIELTVAVPYFRKLIAKTPLDEDWLDNHVALICSIAAKGS